MPDTTRRHRDLARIEADELTATAARITGFAMKRPEFASVGNVSGVRKGPLHFSRRHDSHTLFASDTRYGHLRKQGAWTGSDKKAVATCRKLLRSLQVPAVEVARIDVISEFGQSAQRQPGGDVHVNEPELLRKLARARRHVQGLPVWSSYTHLGLTADGALGWMELHWPKLPPAVLKEASVLQELVDRKFEAPEVPGARVESIEAGVIHSPAVALFMDIAAAVRVIYSVDSKDIGRKPVLYLDRHGDPISRPRDVPPVDREGEKRPAPR